MAISIDKHRVAQRQGLLELARARLKDAFVGIDAVVDELCDAVAVWYTMPEVLVRPVIVNLWGMTGVGKTDLVRRLVAALDQQECFVEIELSNSDTTTWHTSVASRLAEAGAGDGTPAIVLFDEIQRFNTLDSDGDPVTGTKFADFWELLSDGRLARRERDDHDYYFATMLAALRERDKRAQRGDALEPDHIGVIQAQRLKDVFRLDGELDELADLSLREAIDAMDGARASKRIYEPIDCTKCLIIISGNLDDAFSMSGQGSEADVDADIFHAFTTKITLVDIKNSLMRRFKPEQVARFGNTHIIHASLARAGFDELIRREIDRVITTTGDMFGIVLTVDASVRRLIYRNGVFPVQGVRPVFSSVADILESNLAKFLFEAIVHDDDLIDVHYDSSERVLVARFGAGRGTTRVTRVPHAGRVDRIRDEATADRVANVAVHEAGHAVAYGVLFGLSPLQLTARVASAHLAGFTFPHAIHQTRGSLVLRAKVLLAGGLAEELIFGAEHATVGRNHDRETLTRDIIDFVRRYGFDPQFQANYMLDQGYAMDRRITEPTIELMVSRLADETRQLLAGHSTLIAALAVRLAGQGSLTATEVAEVMRHHGVDVEVMAEGHEWVPRYSDALMQVTQ